MDYQIQAVIRMENSRKVIVNVNGTYEETRSRGRHTEDG